MTLHHMAAILFFNETIINAENYYKATKGVIEISEVP